MYAFCQSPYRSVWTGYTIRHLGDDVAGTPTKKKPSSMPSNRLPLVSLIVVSRAKVFWFIEQRHCIGTSMRSMARSCEMIADGAPHQHSRGHPMTERKVKQAFLKKYVRRPGGSYGRVFGLPLANSSRIRIPYQCGRPRGNSDRGVLLGRLLAHPSVKACAKGSSKNK